MKKLAALLVMVAMFGLAACSGEKKDEAPTESPETMEKTEEPAAEEPAAEEPAAEEPAAEEPAAEEPAAEEAAEGDTAEAPAEGGAEAPAEGTE